MSEHTPRTHGYCNVCGHYGEDCIANEPPIITPIVHLNGNRYDSLMGALERAYEAVDAACTAVQATAPNGRNYYPEEGRLVKAEAQHQARMAHLRTVYESLEAEIIQLSEEYERDHQPRRGSR